ncbi:SusC/RagA family TonB-linked outer membrane protein [Flagellimonas beolgyonensis]|uniref:SusC/RagA family TonB-linked outer membrane protein n=1 Tax=Flagellimonas beolgyonensis TaxID=864064 RepID=UPI000F8D8419|nr:SusC/RagA family TonB-linked outer membrane protein [Allomuricauda beolgyonensis]
MKKLSFYVRRIGLFLLFYLLLCPFFPPEVRAGGYSIFQEEVTGKVLDDKGVPLAGVNIVVESSGRGTISDFDGSFAIVASPDDVLVFSMVGFRSLSMGVDGRDVVNVVMEEDVTVLGEVVLNAGYYTVSEKERTGSIVKVGAVAIEKQPVSNPLAALQGRVSGAEVVQTSGLPGTNFNIRIRGRNSIRATGNDPLYVVDGVPYSSSSLGEQQASLPIPGLGVSPLNAINPNDIESIEILKDADATAIYGSRGANGVVLITTKKGRAGDTRARFNIVTGMGSVARYMDLLGTSDFVAMRREAYGNDGIDPIPANAYDINGTWDVERYTDWQKTLFGRTSYMTNVQGSISGGSERTQFLVNGSFFDQTAVFPGDYGNTKVSGLANLSHRSSDGRFSMQLSTNFISERNDLPNGSSLVLEALLLPPNAPDLYDGNGELNWENSTWNNPLRNLESDYTSDATTLIGNAVFSYRMTEGLRFKANLGYTENHLTELRTVPSTIYNPAFGVGSEYSYAVHNTGGRTSWIVEPQLQWEHAFGALKLDVLGGMSFQEQYSDRVSQRATGFSSNSLLESLSAGADVAILADVDQRYRYHAVFGRLNLNLKGRYLLNLTGRRDGSSRFGPEKRFANFGAIGAAWLFSEERPFKGNLSFLSYGKLRGSYGTSGNDQIGDYQYLDTYSFGGSQYQNAPVLLPTRLFNPDFGWESNKKLEFGMELGFWEDRLLVSGNYYQNRSSNQLLGIPLPGTTGFSSINGNLDATVENKGWELELQSTNIRKGSFRWTTSFNLTLPKNRLVSFPDLVGSTYANQLVVGQPLNILKLYHSLGVDPETGIHQFEDFNGDGTISSNDDRQVIKDLNPKYYGGLSNTISLGKFQLDVLFQFSKQLGWNYWRDASIPGSRNNQPIEVLDRWREVGDMAGAQRFSIGQSIDPLIGHFNYQQSDAAVSDASYIRLKTLSLSYEVADKKNKGFGCEVFLRGQNLWTWTDYLGLDPETRSNQTVPPLRMVSIGTQLTF